VVIAGAAGVATELLRSKDVLPNVRDGDCLLLSDCAGVHRPHLQ
jgi:hypothetical protein